MIVQREDVYGRAYYQCDRCGSTWGVPINNHRCGPRRAPRGSSGRNSPRIRRMIDDAEAKRAAERRGPIDPAQVQADIDDLF